MAKKKYIYRFNQHTLSYEKVAVMWRDRLRRISSTMVVGMVLGVALSLLVYHLVDSPKERALKREIAQYRHQLKSLNQQVSRDNAVLADLESRDSAVYRTLFGAPPIREESRYPQWGDYEEIKGFDCSREIESVSRRADTLSQRLYVQSRSIDEVYRMVGTKQQRMAAMPAIMPIPKGQCQLVSGFGMRYHPILHYRRMHTGVDLTAPKGTPVYATADGVVKIAGRGEGASGYGNCVVVDHGFGFQTLYGHLSAVKVQRGQRVKRGELLGNVGSTGLSRGNHLHYEVLQNGTKVNPVFFFFNDLTPVEYEEVIEAANRESQCLS